MTLRARADKLLEELGVNRAASLYADVNALGDAVGCEFAGIGPTLAAVEVQVFGAAGAAEPAVKAEAVQQEASSDSDVEFTGTQTEADRVAAAKLRAERQHDVEELSDDDDDLKGFSIKALKAVAKAKGVDVSACFEKADLVAAIRAAPAALAPAEPAEPEPAAPAAPAAPAPAPAPSGAVRRLTKQMIARVLQGANHYDVLGIEVNATDRDVKVAYRDLACLVHPDKCGEDGAAEAFKKINEANEVLGDSARRSIYDAARARPAPEPAAPPKPARPQRSKRKRGGDDDDYEEESDEGDEESDDDDDEEDEDDYEEEEAPRPPPRRRAPPKAPKPTPAPKPAKSRLEQRGVPKQKVSAGGCVCRLGVDSGQSWSCSARKHLCICGTGASRCFATTHLCFCGTGSSFRCVAKTHKCICGSAFNKCFAKNHKCLCGTPASERHDWTRCVSNKHRCICGRKETHGWDECVSRQHNCICALIRAGENGGWSRCVACH